MNQMEQKILPCTMQLDIKERKKETACTVLFLGIYLKFDTNVTIVKVMYLCVIGIDFASF
jgi:hypothetical protein